MTEADSSKNRLEYSPWQPKGPPAKPAAGVLKEKKGKEAKKKETKAKETKNTG